jgi:hypothetical protein
VTNAVALQRSVSDMITEYEEKSAALAREIESFNQATRRLEVSACVGGAYGGSVFGRGAPSVYEKDLRQTLLVSGWKAIYDRLSIARIASPKDKAQWERTVANPPPLTIENAVATFGDYLLRARWHILRGLAEVFSDLDPAYKSHSKVKVGVAGLPKRVILTNVGSFGSWGRERLIAIVNALAAYRGEVFVDHTELRELDNLHTGFGHKAGEVLLCRREVKTYRNGKDEVVVFPDRGITVRKFKNGNAHVIFDMAALLDINRALAEFYGEVLPDVEEEDAKPRASTAVSKDLAFYPTPVAVIDTVLRAAGIEDRTGWRGDRLPVLRCLEPSCGDGRIMDAIRGLGHHAFGYEVHAGRAAEAMARGNRVVVGNFLEALEPTRGGGFDRVVMNPPFAGQHWRKHLAHAKKFVAPAGVLVCILPATAHYDHDVTAEFGGSWHDLPVASFAESGTNVPTGYLVWGAPRQ